MLKYGVSGDSIIRPKTAVRLAVDLQYINLVAKSLHHGPHISIYAHQSGLAVPPDSCLVLFDRAKVDHRPECRLYAGRVNAIGRKRSPTLCSHQELRHNSRKS